MTKIPVLGNLPVWDQFTFPRPRRWWPWIVGILTVLFLFFTSATFILVKTDRPADYVAPGPKVPVAVRVSVEPAGDALNLTYEVTSQTGQFLPATRILPFEDTPNFESADPTYGPRTFRTTGTMKRVGVTVDGAPTPTLEPLPLAGSTVTVTYQLVPEHGTLLDPGKRQPLAAWLTSPLTNTDTTTLDATIDGTPVTCLYPVGSKRSGSYAWFEPCPPGGMLTVTNDTPADQTMFKPKPVVPGVFIRH
ncbi:MAG: hypothetical protein KDI15_07585 [Thiothrix sp.]|nr:hypothetical protein [Thiothrix sp.]